MKSGIFFERAGILNLTKVERGHQVAPLSFDEFHVNPAATEPLQKLKAAGFVLLATTNQPGLSRGYLPRRELDRMHALLKQRLPLDDRSEEHTSELQSLTNLVSRLLLEKKKKAGRRCAGLRARRAASSASAW